MPPLPDWFPTCGDFDWSAEDFDKAINAGKVFRQTHITLR